MELLTGFGLATAVGLNAYIALLAWRDVGSPRSPADPARTGILR